MKDVKRFVGSHRKSLQQITQSVELFVNRVCANVVIQNFVDVDKPKEDSISIIDAIGPIAG